MYAVDLTKGKIKHAIVELGINTELLKLKNLQDFRDEDLNDEVANLRYDYYTRKQLDLVKKINDKVRESMLKPQKSINTRPVTFMTQITEIDQSKISEVDKLKMIQQRKLINSLKDIERNIIGGLEIDKRVEKSREAKQKHLSMKTVRKATMEKFKEKQVENLMKIKKTEEKRTTKTRYSTSTPKVQRTNSGEYYFKDTYFNEADPKIEEKMQNYEARMKKSQAVRENQINLKKTAVTKLLEKFPPKQRENSLENESEKIIKLINKQEAFKERHDNMLAYQQSKRLKVKNDMEKRFEDVKKKLKNMDLHDEKDMVLKRKNAKSEQILKQKHNEWVKKLEIRSEVHRLKEESIAIELERINNMVRYKRDQVMDKRYLSVGKIDRIYKMKERKAQKTMDKMYKSMIEREKINEIIINVSKSPDYKHLRKKIDELEEVINTS
ncbi:hypothetical protein SteCoe_13876 [Stentor coeruleus]|uniref:Uncharacterized protein n=1 Tax=Stentor coeruleus TaxID=5963 RepID=A0A1R2C799_9CILI|nr:hypothetical protein SteCoe_13876 [Stentor coeruleus]